MDFLDDRQMLLIRYEHDQNWLAVDRQRQRLPPSGGASGSQVVPLPTGEILADARTDPRSAQHQNVLIGYHNHPFFSLNSYPKYLHHRDAL